MSFKEDYETIVRIAHANERLRPDLMEAVRKHAVNYIEAEKMAPPEEDKDAPEGDDVVLETESDD